MRSQIDYDEGVIRAKFPDYDREYHYGWRPQTLPAVGEQVEVPDRDGGWKEVTVTGHGRQGYDDELVYARPCRRTSITISAEEASTILDWKICADLDGRPSQISDDALVDRLGEIANWNRFPDEERPLPKGRYS